MKIALIRERKQPADLRVALDPQQAAQLAKMYPNVQVAAESCSDRVYSDDAYRNAGVPIIHSPEDFDVLLGVKEVPVADLIPGKSYFFFSHTHKFQVYNRPLLRAVLEKKIRLIDYECLEWPGGGRILGFGRWAGIVGVYNGFRTWGLKTGVFHLKPAYECRDYSELKSALSQIRPGAIRITLTGSGRVAGGALEVLNFMGIRELSPEEYLSGNDYNEPVFTQLTNPYLYRRKDGAEEWDSRHFYSNHAAYTCIVEPYLKVTDLLINGMYWENTLEPLFTKEETAKPEFRVKVIADITCDVEGSVPITLRATTIQDPVIGWDPVNLSETTPYTEGCIDVMAVTNLPAELPADASTDFGKSMLEDVLPLLFNGDPDGVLKAATIAENGHLTEKYNYLKDFVSGS
ncbi:MAG: alanine dehydrogenase [Flavobacteriales bacterium]|nr:alanine dehydrogenase [Flavobacteriales bacterium]